MDEQNNNKENKESYNIAKDGIKRDPPPVFVMPDGQSYLHVNRNGLIFGCATDRNISPCTVIEVRGMISFGSDVVCVDLLL